MLSGCIYENELGTIITCCRSYLSDHASFKLAFIREQANRAAHIFARASVFQSRPSISVQTSFKLTYILIGYNL